MIKFTIPYPPKKQMARFCKEYGLNSIYAGKHWSKRKEDKEYWHLLVQSEMRRQGIQREFFKNPVQIAFSWNDGLDCSNHAYMAKMIEDSMIGYLLEDDNRKHVKQITHKFHDGNYILVEITEVQNES